MVALGGLAACVTSPAPRGDQAAKLPTPRPHEKIGNPYKIGGRVYVPHADPNYAEVGEASWYGPKFHGKLTANGELFDENRLTAAHRTLPLPSLVRVRNLENGRTAVLRVNDRGPFANDRIIDLSKAAAERLGTKEQGVARVQVEYLGAARLSDAITTLGAPEDYAALHIPMEDQGGPAPTPKRYADAAPRPAPAYSAIAAAPSTVQALPAVPQLAPIAASPANTQGYYVAIGSYTDVRNVRAIRARLPDQIPVRVESDGTGMNVIHHVQLGPYTHEFAAVEAQRYARAEGFVDAHIVRTDEAQ
ncbi:MAG: septal ring lytic transglycosylase RlpA family protein [Parvularcula sp.]